MLKRTLFAALILGLALFALAACGQDNPAEQAEEPAAATPAEDARPVKIVYVEWSCATASTNMVAAVLQEKLGYEVEMLPVAAAVMWQAIGSGDADATVTAWLPVTHADYLASVQDNVVDLGPIYEGAKLGLVVPSYVTIDSVADLEANAAQFDDRIIGIDPGAGLMKMTEQAIADYHLDSFELMEGSGATMTAALADAIRNNQWVVVTGWSPHWMFGKFDLKYLADPQGVFGGAETIDTVVHKGLEQEMPEVYAFLDRFYWPEGGLPQVMVWNQEEGADPYQNAIRYMNENPDVVAEWLGQ